MNHILKLEEWESNGYWLCGDVSALAADSNTWWYIPALLSISPVEYIHLLIEKFHAVKLSYEVKYDVLIFRFSSLADCRKFKNYINKMAREKKFVIY